MPTPPATTCRLYCLLAVAATACGASATFRNTGTPPHPLTARNADSVVVFPALPASPPAVEIGQLSGSSGTHSPVGDGKAEALLQLRSIAGQNGCDFIVVAEPQEQLFGTSNGTPLYKTHQDATCFVNR